MKFKSKNIVSGFLLVLFSLLSAVTFFSCQKKDELKIVFDNSQPLALAPDVEWAVIIEPYAAYREEKGWTSDVAGHCRKGDILQIKGKSVDSQSETWYFVENGWLPSSCLSVYSNRLKAQAVSKELLEQDKRHK